MQLVLAGHNSGALEPWRAVFHDDERVEFRVGSLPGIGFACDAQIVPAFLAHDRYGGVPDYDSAQVLVNTRGDGGPGLVVATPMYGPMTRWEGSEDAARERVAELFEASFDEIDRYNSNAGGDGGINRVLILVTAMGFEGLGSAASSGGLRRAVEGRT